MIKKIYEKKFSLISIIIIILLLLIFSVLLAAGTKYHLKKGQKFEKIRLLSDFVSEIPFNITRIFDIPQINKSYIQKKNLKYKNNFKNGYLLVSAYSKQHSTSNIYLVDLKNNKTIYEWIVKPQQIKKYVKNKKNDTLISVLFRSQHPLLTDSGDIIFSSGNGPLVRLDKCSKIKWVSDHIFHHSIEKDINGNLVVPIDAKEEFYPFIMKSFNDVDKNFNFRDDGFAIVDSKTGKILKKFSISKILIENNLSSLLINALNFSKDPIHLNDAEPILISDQYVQKNDIMLSARSLNLVALYRPSSNKIIWYKTTPWTMQHDIDYQGNGIFTLYGNDNFTLINGRFRSYASIYTIDIKNDKISKQTLKKIKVANTTQGLHHFIDDNSIFIDDGGAYNYIIDKDTETKMIYFKEINEKYNALLHWNRFIPEGDFINQVILNLNKNPC